MVLPIGIYHRLKSQATRETLDRRQEGLFILATLRPMGAVFWIGLIAWMVDPGWMSGPQCLPVWLRWTGVGVIALACGLLVWTFRSLGRNLTDTVVTGNSIPRCTRPLFLDPASVIRLGRAAHVGSVSDCGELVPLRDRRCDFLSTHDPNEDRREEPGGSLWRQLSNVHGKDRAFFA